MKQEIETKKSNLPQMSVFEDDAGKGLGKLLKKI